MTASFACLGFAVLVAGLAGATDFTAALVAAFVEVLAGADLVASDDEDFVRLAEELLVEEDLIIFV